MACRQCGQFLVENGDGSAGFTTKYPYPLNSNEFAFKSIQDVLEENQKLREENEDLNDALKNNITEILNVLHSHEQVISRLDSEQIQISVDVASKLTTLQIGILW